MGNSGDENKGLSFRAQLVLFGLLLVLIVALPVLFVEVQRPWDALDVLIGQGNAVLAGVKSGMDENDLQRMNEFALRVSPLTDDYDEDALVWTFNMLIMKGKLLSEEGARKVLEESGAGLENYDYAKVQKAFAFWQDQFSSEPGLTAIFGKYKERLIQTRENSRTASFEFKDVYIMVDDGKTFAFLLDGFDWVDSTYPGLEYDVTESHDEYWRAYWQKGPGYDTNPKHYYWKIFPKFDSDKWGAWFTIWLAEKNNEAYNAFSMDFDAARVKKAMQTVGVSIIGISLVLIVIIILVSHKISNLLTVPIKHIIAATEAVIAGDYDHVVPDVGGRDFKKPIATMNHMIRDLKERFNMKQTLEKLLSKELAEQVAKHGLVLGGQKVNITNVFTDFAGFSTITQGMNPEETVGMLNEYFTDLIPIIKKWGGLPDKYIGDAIVAIFGAPIYLENHAEHAVGCAIEMQRVMRRINEQRIKQGKLTLEMRIGLNSGDVIAGAMGSDMKLEYTTIGETTNLANRMESMCEIGHVLMAEATYYKIKHIFFKGIHVSPDPQFLKVKGYDLPVPAHSVYVADIKISKNAAATSIRDFYLIEKVDRRLPSKPEDLDPDHPERFTQTVIIA